MVRRHHRARKALVGGDARELAGGRGSGARARPREGRCPQAAVSASVSLDRALASMRAGEGGREEACLREAARAKLSLHDREVKCLSSPASDACPRKKRRN